MASTSAAATGGGAATTQGVDYQSRVAAWLAVRALVGSSATPLWDWPQASELREVWVETDDHVDDIRTSIGLQGSAYIQAKHRLTASSSLNSEFGKTVRQFVRQLPDCGDGDKLVLTTSSGSSQPIREALSQILHRARRHESARAIDLCRNDRERRIHKALVDVATRAWEADLERKPAEQELASLLSHMYVTIVDPYDDESEEREALQLLRGCLDKPADARAAWQSIRGYASQTGILRSRITPAWLASRLEQDNFFTNAASEFKKDSETLASWSSVVAQQLSVHLSITSDDGSPVHLERELMADLVLASEDSLLVTGEPGAGKSGCLAELANVLGRDHDVVFLAAGSLHANSLGTMRNELSLANNLVDVITQWRGRRPAYLIIDALDAGRASDNQQAFMELISAVLQSRSRWRVIASVRRFDLRHNVELQDLFQSSRIANEKYSVAEFEGIRHFCVPELDESDFESFRSLAPKLYSAIANAGDGLRALLANFFCLKIFADLARSSDLGDEPLKLQTRTGLLDQYWRRRVSTSGADGVRNAITVRGLCEAMLNRRSLTVLHSDFVTYENSAEVDRLLRSGVLAEEGGTTHGGPTTLGFAHHVLFDYAISLLIRLSSTPLAAFIARDRTRLFVAWPSFQMHFEFLWNLDPERTAFWSATLDLSRAEDVPEIARIIAPVVAASQLTEASDLNPLFEALGKQDEAALGVLRHLIHARLADTPGMCIPLDRESAWGNVLAELLVHLSGDTAPMIWMLEREFVQREQIEDSVLLEIVGRTARTLLEWAWDSGVVNGAVEYVAIRGLCLTFTTAPEPTRRLVHRIISSDQLANLGYIEMPLLARYVNLIWTHDPSLTRDIYIAAFDFEESSTEKTAFSGGVVLPLSSNRRQDYEMSHYSLKTHFPDFLRAAPNDAAAALSAIGRKYAARFRWRSDSYEILWEHKSVQIVEDSRFGAGEPSVDSEAEMLNAWGNWVSGTDISDQQSRVERAEDALTLLLGLDAPSEMWRAVLKAFSTEAATLVPLLPLLTAPNALLSTGLSRDIGAALKAGYSRLASAQRLRIDNAILNLATTEDFEEAYSQSARDRLISCLPSDSIVSPTLLDYATQLVERYVPDQETDFDHPIEYDNDFWLRSSGIDPNEPANAAVLRLAEPIKEFVSKYLNGNPSTVDSDAIWESVLRLWQEIELETATSRLLELSRADIAQALDRMVATDWALSLNSGNLAKLREIVFQLSESESPSQSKDDGSSNIASWLGEPRAISGTIIISLARIGLAEYLANRLRELARDPAPHVRLAILVRASLLKGADDSLLCEIVRESIEAESVGPVIAQLEYLLYRLQPSDESLISTVARLYRRAVALGDEGKSAREAACDIATASYIWQDSSSAYGLLQERLADLSAPPWELVAMRHGLRSAFETCGSEGSVSDRGFGLATAVAASTASRLQTALKPDKEDNAGPEQGLENARELGSLLDGLGGDLYFGSGAYTNPTADDERPKPPIDRYYEEAREFIRALLAVPHPGIVHHILETLDYLLPADPERVFLDVAETVAKGKDGGYEYDSMGCDLVVAIVSRYLAKHRSLLQSRVPLQEALVQILDTLVSAGWPSATSLTYQLQNVFR